MHIVAGIDWRLGEDLDFVAELGLAVNDEGHFSAAQPYYFR